MTLREFAEQNRLHLNDRKIARKYRLSWADDVIPGTHGELVDMGDDGLACQLFRIRLLAVPRNASMSKALLTRRRRALEAGLQLKWKADAESIFYFDPSDLAQAALAIELVGARRKKTVSAEQRARLAEQLKRARERKAA